MLRSFQKSADIQAQPAFWHDVLLVALAACRPLGATMRFHGLAIRPSPAMSPLYAAILRWDANLRALSASSPRVWKAIVLFIPAVGILLALSGYFLLNGLAQVRTP